MEGTLAIAVAGLIAIAFAAVAGPRLKVPPPLILLVVGVAVSLVPLVQDVRIDPELILVGVLPPLLFTASTSLPAMELRREFGAVSGLSVVLVLLTALVLGGVFSVLVPGIGFPAGVALGAVISPTDAVATSIVRRSGVSSRVTAILEGESLLNDASALVLLRAAVASIGAVGTTISVPGVLGDFAWSILVAVLIGVLVARLGQLVRPWVKDPAVGTLLSFALPFIASLPAEALHASGLVAAVAAGLVVGRRSARVSSPQQRLSDQQSWRTISTGLEGAVFLLMGLQVKTIVADAGGPAVGWTALGLGALAVGITLVVRSAFVAPLLGILHLGSKRGQDMKRRLDGLQEPQVGDDPMQQLGRRRRSRPLRRTVDVDRFRKRLRQALADIDYLAARPLGPKEGVIVVWAGMRGAVTVAAAQTLLASHARQPEVLVLIAFAAAAVSLVLQGGTIAALIAVLKPRGDDPIALAEERERIRDLMRRSLETVPEVAGESRVQSRVRQLTAQRDALLDARDDGVFDSALLAAALETVDSAQITTELFDDPDR